MWNTTRSVRTRRWATGHRHRKPSFQNRGMEMWKTKPVSHISTPPATTTDKGQKRRYTNIPLGTKDRSGQERRDHLNLQVDLLAEKEITTLLQMVRAICGHMGLQGIMADKDIRELSKNTSIESLSQTLEDRLPDK